MLRIVLFLSRMDSRTMLRIVLFLSFTSGKVLARLPESRLLSETHNKSPIPYLIAGLIGVIALVAVYLIAYWIGVSALVAVALLIFGTYRRYCRKARPPTRIDEESNPKGFPPPTRTDEDSNPKGFPPPTRTDEDSNPKGWVTYPVRDLIVATRNFSDSNLVGEGGFGRVYRADLGGNRIGAVKRLLEVDSTLFGAELSILLRLPRHPNLVNLLGICSDPDDQMIIFEYVAHGTLFSRLHENQAGASPLSWASRKKIARQVAEALRHLHERANPPIIHRDVKSKNVLLENDFSAKLADFGIAKLGSGNTTPRGTPGYMDPQYFSEGRCSAKSDVYSFGVLLLELITGSKALIGTENLVIRTRTDRLSTDTNNIIKIVDQSLPDRNNRNELHEMIGIANLCLESERGNRPSMAEVVNLMDIIRNA